jgi:hypothetical protein
MVASTGFLLRPTPKDLRANIKERRRIWEACAVDKMAQEDCWIRCSRDLIFWVDTFAWTYSPLECPDQPHRPFISYEFQAEALLRLNEAIGGKGVRGHDVLVEKSRNMGASWICLAVFTWRWLFYPGQSFLVGSKVQEYVDKKGNPKALFWKFDYLIEHLPAWMKPPVESTSMHRANEANGSVIDGESTTGGFGRGDRRTAVLMDEFAEIQVDGYAVLSSTRDMTRCRIFNSTPAGAAGAYFDTREKMRKNSPGHIIRMHWSDHPLYNPGLYTTVDGKSGSAIKIIDRSYTFPPGYSFINDGKLRSVWYDEQCLRAAHPQEIATQLDIDYAGSGWQFFDPVVMREIIEQFAKPPVVRGECNQEQGTRRPIWLPQSAGRLRLWIQPDAEGRIPKHLDDMAIACDIAAGTGGEESSNSVASICNRKTGEKVGQFWSNKVSPRDFARYVVNLCKWFNGAFLIWEKNGPGGETFTNEVIELGYLNVYYHIADDSFEVDIDKKPGWTSGKARKNSLLSSYAEALMYGYFQNPCEESLLECLEYVHQPNGDIIHARSKDTVDPASSGESHGDMVIADALAVRAMKDRIVEDLREHETTYKPGTYGYRLQAHLHAEAQPDYY